MGLNLDVYLRLINMRSLSVNSLNLLSYVSILVQWVQLVTFHRNMFKTKL
jgi:hypothetical protein